MLGVCILGPAHAQSMLPDAQMRHVEGVITLYAAIIQVRRG